MKRNLRQFENQEFDLLVIGGGINGAGIAWDAALRGLKVALVEKKDFGGATSAGCFKIVHGGMRYLQHFDLPRLFESVKEQKFLRKAAPHLVHPLPFLVPCYGYGMRGKEIMNLGMSVYDALTCFKNKNISESHKLPFHRLVSPEECLKIAPELKKDGLRGGAIYYDAQIYDCERLTYSVAHSAFSAGAVIANYAEVKSLAVEKDENNHPQIKFVMIEDAISKQQYKVQTKFVVNATGPWTHEVWNKIQGFDYLPKKPRMFSKGIQVVLPPLIKECAVAIESKYSDPASITKKGGRSFFLTPWRGHTLLGTSDKLVADSPEDFRITEEEIEQFVADAHQAYPSALISKKNVKSAFGGLRIVDESVLDLSAEGDATAARDDEVVEHYRENRFNAPKVSNMISVSGIKYTTFRNLAEKIVDKVCSQINHQKSSITFDSKIYGGDIESYQEFKNSFENLVKTYGSNATEIIRIFKENPDLSEELIPGKVTIKAELRFAFENEMVVKDEDAINRRTGLGSLEKLSLDKSKAVEKNLKTFI
jgi:glycerol-3-phosphate dehydrogenase